MSFAKRRKNEHERCTSKLAAAFTCSYLVFAGGFGREYILAEPPILAFAELVLGMVSKHALGADKPCSMRFSFRTEMPSNRW